MKPGGYLVKLYEKKCKEGKLIRASTFIKANKK